jgi:hypothetical protein
MHPLLIPTRPASFARREKGKPPIAGLVYGQYRSQDDDTQHPSCFYVKFPDTETGPTHEISARKLASILGDGGSSRAFVPSEIARVIERMDPMMELQKLLPKLKP